jgi:hypothetical protein
LTFPQAQGVMMDFVSSLKLILVADVLRFYFPP